jgi:hypothetical protein
VTDPVRLSGSAAATETENSKKRPKLLFKNFKQGQMAQKQRVR